MSKHTLIRRAVLEKLESVTGAPVTLFDGLPAFVEQEDLPAIAVWLTDAQYTGLMTDEDDWQATLHTAVFLRAQAPDTELDIWMEEKIFPALEEVSGLERLIDTMTPLGYDYQRDSEMATWGMAEITYRIRGLTPGRYTLSVRAVNSQGQQGDPASTQFSISAPAAPSFIELTPGYFQITATPRQAVYDPTVQYEFWFSDAQISVNGGPFDRQHAENAVFF